MTKTICQLAAPISEQQVEKYIHDDRWWFEPKLDGVRMIVRPDGPFGNNRFYSRKGDELVAPFNFPAVPFPIDGEYVDGVLYVFDAIIEADYTERRKQLEEWFTETNQSNLKLIPLAKTTKRKELMYDTLRGINAEGIVIKDSRAPYKIGRTKSWLKFKFYTTVDVIVTELNRKGKDEAISIGWADGTEAGGCKVIESKIVDLNVGDVVEIRCLDVSDSGKLIQPVFVRKRTDKLPEECVKR